MNEQLKKKVDQAIRLLQTSCKGKEVELCYSGGKDSDVILELAKMAGINYRAIYKSTTIDPEGTIAHVKSKGVEIHRPKMSFLEIVKKKGMPTMRARFCCEILKEYKILDNAIQGIRRCESTKRSKRYSEEEPIICRIYGSKKNHVNVILPILNWSDKDVEEFITERNIQCAPVYYDENGAFHVERRLGCIGCPLKADRGKADFKKYPKFARLVINAIKQFMDTHPNCASVRKFGDAYHLFFHNVFCKTYDEYIQRTQAELLGGGKPDIKKLMENYFGIEL